MGTAGSRLASNTDTPASPALRLRVSTRPVRTLEVRVPGLPARATSGAAAGTAGRTLARLVDP